MNESDTKGFIVNSFRQFCVFGGLNKIIPIIESPKLFSDLFSGNGLNPIRAPLCSGGLVAE